MGGNRLIDRHVTCTSHDEFDLQSYMKNVVSGKSHEKDHVEEILSEPPILEPVEMTNDQDLQQFVKDLKKWRNQFDILQRNVAVEIRNLLGVTISRRLINRFENFNLSTKLMRSLKSVLQLWIQDIYTSDNTSGISKPKKIYPCNTPEFIDLRINLRRPFCQLVKDSLEKVFLANPRPAPNEIAMLAKSLNVRICIMQDWFNNRQKRKLRSRPPTGSSVCCHSASPSEALNLCMPVTPKQSVTAVNFILQTSTPKVNAQDSISDASGE